MYSSSGDTYTFGESLQQQIDEPVFTKKTILSIPDSQLGNYSGSIVFDGQNVSGHNSYHDLSDIRLDIPYVVKGTSTTLKNINASTITLKNGLDIIDSIQIEAGGSTVTPPSSYSNQLFNFQKVTSTAKDHDEKYGLFSYYAKNDGKSFVYSSNAASEAGDGVCNNKAFHTDNVYDGGAYIPGGANEGAKKRCALMYDTINGVNNLGITIALTSTECSLLNKSNFKLESGTNDTDGAVYSWSFLVSLRLSDLSDVFKAIGLIKGTPFRIVINYNSATWTVTQVGSTTEFTSLVQGLPVIDHGSCNPVLVMSGEDGNPNSYLYDTTGTGGSIAFVGNVYKTGSTTCNFNIGSCMMYIPQYTLKPDYETALIENPIKEFKYHTFVTNTLTSSFAADATCNFTITNSLPNMKYLVVIPHTTAGTGASATGMVTNSLLPFTSCFDTSPDTTSPYAALTNIQVYVGGDGLFNSNIRYDSEMFDQEISKINCINNGQSDLTSGLLNYGDWDSLYRYYAFDLSRASSDGKPKSLAFTAQNKSKRALDLYFFIVYQKQATINRVSGKLDIK